MLLAQGQTKRWSRTQNPETPTHTDASLVTQVVLQSGGREEEEAAVISINDARELDFHMGINLI